MYEKGRRIMLSADPTILRSANSALSSQPIHPWEEETSCSNIPKGLISRRGLQIGSSHKNRRTKKIVSRFPVLDNFFKWPRTNVLKKEFKRNFEG